MQAFATCAMCAVMFYGAYIGDRSVMIIAILCLILFSMPAEKKGSK